jgi:GT2 family glycosyltransferase
MPRIAVVTVPFIKADLHRALADECISSICSTHAVERIAIVNSIRSPDDAAWLEDRFDLIQHNDTNILARAWNRGISLALDRGAELVVVANLDIVFHPLCLDNLLECSRQEAEAVMWSPIPWRDRSTFLNAQLVPACTTGITWSCFAVNRRLFEELGMFDEGYVPAYREDSDMAYRMNLAGLRGVSCRSALFFDHERGTIKGLFDCDPSQVPQSASLLADLRASITRNDERYIRKWGGLGGVERFTIPYNGQSSP